MNTLNLRHLRVSIHGKAVIYTVDSQMARDATESEDWEKFVRVIWLNNLSNIENGALVLILSA